MTQSIATLRPAEKMIFDHAKLAGLCDRLGSEAEGFIATALTEIETLVALVGGHDADLALLERNCRDLRNLSDGIGMTSMVQATAAILTCIAQDDIRALPACIARVRRLGEPRGVGHWTLSNDTVA